MKKVLLAGGAVALGDGVLLGTTIALGWTVVAILLVGAGIAGATLVAAATPAPRAPVRPSTVTLGLPLRDPVATESADEADAVATTGIVPEPQVAEPAAVAA